MSEPAVTFTLKEMFEGVNERLDRIETKLDKEMEHLEGRVESLEKFRNRFLPTSVVVILLMVLGLIADLFIRFHA